jgi:calcineurin-like phosphoesterase family protein
MQFLDNMSKNIYLFSDPHFGHANICNFKRDDGSPLRPWDNVEEMNEELVRRWNDTVKEGDKVYVLGDVAMGHRNLSVLDRLKGRKCLIRGNHDNAKLSQLSQFFYDIRGTHFLDNLVLSHIPVHPCQFYGKFQANVHGHLHYRRVELPDGSVDPRYVNVCVEHTNYCPISLEAVKEIVSQQLLSLKIHG